MPNTESDNQSGAPPALVTAVKRVLRPLVGLLLDHNLTYTWLSGILKSIFVEVAEREFRLHGKEQTDSRITLLTGVHRKDVRRLRREPAADEAPPASVYLGAQLVALWISDDRFLDNAGGPRPLPRRRPDDGLPSFEDLVTSVSKDIRPRAVLDEWLRLDAIEIDNQDRVCLKVDAFIPSKGFEELAYYFGRNLHDHIAAARHNVQGGEPPFLERSVYYDELSPASVKALAALSETEGMKALKALNRRARTLQNRDRESPDAQHRMNFGIYFFGIDERHDDPETDTGSDTKTP